MNLLNCTKEESLNLLDLRKEVILLECNKHENLNGIKSRAAFVIDVSGSMIPKFNSGIVQAVLERMFAIAVQFDDNATMEIWIFNGGFVRMPDVTMDNFYGYVEREIINKNLVGGGTNYTPVIQDIIKRYMNEEPAPIANYVMFMTDGDNSWADKENATNELILSSYTPTFWQFVGIGDNSFEFLKQLDIMEGRNVDNANFFALNDIMSISDSDLYARMLAEFPQWLSLDKVKDMIANPCMPSRDVISVAQPKAKKGLFGKLFG